MESDVRYYRRRATEELAAARRAVTEAAHERRMMMAGVFLERLEELGESRAAAELGLGLSHRVPPFQLVNGGSAERV
jgi:hypothetical protein